MGAGNVIAVTSALYNVPGVTSIAFLENTADTTQTISGISLVAHSIWACVQGGTDANIALALLRKSGGCGYNGAVTVNVVEPASGQVYPVKFARPTLIQIAVRVTVSQGTNTTDLIKTAAQAVQDFVNGNIPGEVGWAIGYNASPFDVAGAVADECPGVRVRLVEIANVFGLSYQTTEISVAIDHQAVLNTNYLTIILV